MVKSNSLTGAHLTYPLQAMTVGQQKISIAEKGICHT